jgi:antitoxin (DNA-binding transcriptional repressor) of toxin-antitoxin stability system
MTMITQVGAAKLDDLLKQVQAGNEVLLVDGDKPVARLTAAVDLVKENEGTSDKGQSILNIRAIEGPRVLIPNFTHAEVAEEMFDRQ